MSPTRHLPETCALWGKRGLLDLEPDALINDKSIGLTSLEMNELFVKEFYDDYTSEIERKEHDLIVKEMMKLVINEKLAETDLEKSIDSPIAEGVWTFVKLLGERLKSDSIGNLFRSDKHSPTTNYLSHLLQHHHLKCSFDFEKAVKRELNRATGHALSWNMSVIDVVGGNGTSVETIFLLKEQGIMKGVKRRCFVQAQSPKDTKCRNLCEMVENLSIGPLPDPAKNSKTPEPQPAVLGRSSSIKLGRHSPDSPRKKITRIGPMQNLKQTKIGGFFISKQYGLANDFSPVTSGSNETNCATGATVDLSCTLSASMKTKNVGSMLKKFKFKISSPGNEYVPNELDANIETVGNVANANGLSRKKLRRKRTCQVTDQNLGSPLLKPRTIIDFIHGERGEQAGGRALFNKAADDELVLRNVSGMCQHKREERELSDQENQLQDGQSCPEF